jgi:hypothetical protein
VRVFEVIPPLADTGMTAGRGSGKITPQALVDEFWPAFARDQAVIPIGMSRLLLLLQRTAPGVADRIRRRGLQRRPGRTGCKVRECTRTRTCQGAAMSVSESIVPLGETERASEFPVVAEYTYLNAAT